MEKISQADIIKTHLLYLEKLDGLLDRERTYYHNEYFPFLKKVYQTLKRPENGQEDGRLSAREFDGTTEYVDPVVKPGPKPQTYLDEFSFSRNISAIQLTLSRVPKEIVTVGIVSGLEAFDNGRGVFWNLVQGVDYTVDYTRGTIAIHTETNKEVMLKSVSAGDPYSLVVKYIPLDKSAYDVGEDGET